MPAAWAYFDTSVLVKRYVKQTGSTRAAALLRRYRFLSSAIAPVEATSAFRRQSAAGGLSQRDLTAILARMRRDRAYWELVEVSGLVLDRAEELIRGTGLRTLDAIHVASALIFRGASGMSIPFVTADAAQREAASQVNLDVTWIAGERAARLGGAGRNRVR
jgi:predicted nucleic acid-binding protein